MTREEFDIAFRKACDETKGCVVFESGNPKDFNILFWYEGTFDEAWKIFERDGYTTIRASRPDEDTEL